MQTALDVLLNTVTTAKSLSCHSGYLWSSKSTVVSVAVILQLAQLCESCHPKCLTLLGTTCDGRKWLPSSIMSAITGHLIGVSVVGLAYNES